MHSTHTLVHTPGTAGRADLVEPPSRRAAIARPPRRVAGEGERARAAGAAVRLEDSDASGGLVLGRYSLCERLGAGGFGVVWRARDELLGREVALKRISLPDGDSERAGREALAAARLAHPAIVALYEACAASDAFYLISELVRGETLARLIGTRALDDARVLGIGVALADALAHAHARGVIHRDVKPQNVLVPHESLGGMRPPRGSPAAAKLTDFGGARLAGDDVLTRTGDVLGTLAYMAPEQSDGGEAGEAADLYSLALILYEAFSGVNPVRGATPAATARRIGRPLESLRSSRGDLPRALTRALDRALSPRPGDRGTVAELRATLADAPAARRQPRPGARAALAALASAPAWEAAPARAPDREVAPGQPAPRSATRPRRAAWARARPASTRSQESLAALAPSVHPWPSLPGEAREQPRRTRPASRPRHEARLVLEPAGGAAAASGPSRHLALLRNVWIGCAVAAMIWQAWIGRAGLALLMLAALLPVFALSSERTRRAPEHGGGIAGGGLIAGALAPILGLAGLAGAFPALAGQASGWRTRAALGALGYWWLTLSEPLLTRRLWLGPPPGTGPRAAWEASLSGAAVHVLGPMLSVGVLLGAALWGAGALCLPWIVRGRRAALDIVAVTSWSAALAVAAPLLDRGLASGAAHASPRGAVLGAVLGAVFAVAVRALRGPV